MQHVSVLKLNPQQYWQKVQRSTDPALCLPPAIIMRSGVTVETGACSSSRAVVRGVGRVGGRHTHAAQHWVQQQVSAAGLWLAKYKQIASQSPGWSRLNKYSKISNSCVSFESNRTASNYSIRFEISNIRTALVYNPMSTYTTELNKDNY